MTTNTVHSETQPRTRRDLPRLGMGLAAACGLPRTAEAEEPFDSLPPAVPRNARRNGLVMIHHPAPASLASRARIVSTAEPGEPLEVAGQVFAPNGSTPVPGLTVYAYNTDAQGYYGENRTAYPPRLYGWMKTDAAGRFELPTIHPRPYPGMQVPPHVHFSF